MYDMTQMDMIHMEALQYNKMITMKIKAAGIAPVSYDMGLNYTCLVRFIGGHAERTAMTITAHEAQKKI